MHYVSRFGTRLVFAAGYAAFCRAAACYAAVAGAGLAGSGLVLQAATPAEVAARVDATLFEEVLSASPADSNAQVSDELFLRRASLDLLGTLPGPEEITRFSLDTRPDKRVLAVRQMLADSRYGQNWARYWRDVILSRRTEDRALLSAMALEKYLTEQLNTNQPWSQITQDFVTAKGNVQENGATAVIMSQMGETEETAAEVARIFLGVQIQCAQCHDHPTDRWKRQQFHEFAAFFPRLAVRPVRDDGQRQGFEVVSAEFEGRGPRQLQQNRMRGREREHFMPDKDDASAKGTLVHPIFFLNGRELGPSKTDEERRSTLAAWMTQDTNPWFARAFVNRMWAELVGEGFYEPIDDLGPDRTATAPKTLDLLATEFVNAGHDVKWLMETITQTDAYQRMSRQRRNANETPFAANCPQPLRADQLYTTLVEVLNLADPSPNEIPNAPNAYRQGRSPRIRFAAVFGYDPSVPRDEVTLAIPQVLLLMNSPLLNAELNAAKPNTIINRLLKELPDDRDVAWELYLRFLGREPSEAEIATCLEYVKEVGSRAEAFEDLAWSLMNSYEFLHRN